MSPGSLDIMANGGGTVEEDDYSHEHHKGAPKHTPYEDNKSHYGNQGRTSFEEPKVSTTPIHYSHELDKAKPGKLKPISVSPIQDSADVAMSSETSDPKFYDTWENKHGGDLISDQQSEEINSGSIHQPTEQMETIAPASSGATSNHPIPYGPIQQMIERIQKTFAGRTYDPNEEGNDGFTIESLPHSYKLGKGKPEHLKFSWMLSNWSKCSQTCGATGFQVRGSKCTVRLNNVTKDIDSSLCLDAGLTPPITTQKCGLQECPHWETGSWSKCTATCGAQSFQTRILQCVWYGTRRPAGNACRDQPRPTVLRPCKTPPCPPSERRLRKPIQIL